jgi:hypothetical protein
LTFQEKRKLDRYTLKLPTWISLTVEGGQRKTIELFTSNICSGGAFFDTNTPLSIGTNVDIDILLPFKKLEKSGGRKSRIDVSGSVIRTEDSGMAVMFNKQFQISPEKNY